MYKNLFLIVIFIFIGCSSKEVNYNKAANVWYSEILESISNYQMDNADEVYISLESEHRKSPLLAPASIMMAAAYMDEENYTMANYYLDKYISKFSYSKKASYVQYLKIKSKFLSFENQFRDQQLLQETINDVDLFVLKFPESEYLYLAKTIQARLYMAKYFFDKEISKLYVKLDKANAAASYEEKTKKYKEISKDAVAIDVSWVRYLLE